MTPELREQLQNTISATSDDELVNGLVNVLSGYLGNDPNLVFDRFEDLPDGLQLIWATRLVEAEVLNGGFNQLYWNPTAAYVEFAADCYRELGIPEAAELVERSIEIVESERPILERFWRAGTADAVAESYKHTSLGSLDSRFAALERRAEEARISLVRGDPNRLLFG